MSVEPSIVAPAHRASAWLGDLAGGVTSAVVALPLALAFAIASGVDPKAGLYTAIVAGIVASLFGGAPLQITGPTGAMAVVLVGIVAQYGLQGVMVAGLMAGAIQLGLGLARLGRLASLLPMPVITGFTAGIGVIIFLGQLGNASGLTIAPTHGGPLSLLSALTQQLARMNPAAIALTAGVLAIMWLWPKLNKSIPPSLVALLVLTGVATCFALDVPRIGSVPQGLPMPGWVPIDLSRLGELVRPAIALAALGSIESLLSAAVADRLAGSRPHDPDRELIGQGLANIAVPFFGGIPATGAIARTAVNIRAGAKTRFSGVVHGVTIALVLVALGPFAAQIPLAVLAGILLAVSARMIEWDQIKLVMRSTRSDTTVLLLTWATTVAFDLVLAVEVGLTAAAILFIRRMADLHVIKHPEVVTAVGLPASLAQEIAVYDLDRPLFFGDAHRFAQTMLESPIDRAVVLCMDSVTTMDVTAALALGETLVNLRRREVAVALCGLQPPVAAMLERLELLPPEAEVPRFEHVAQGVAALSSTMTQGRASAA
jgi:sulfate permease, SulP family